MARNELTLQFRQGDDPLTVVLRATGWRPWKDHPCGCERRALCAFHAGVRADEHYNSGQASS